MCIYAGVVIFARRELRKVEVIRGSQRTGLCSTPAAMMAQVDEFTLVLFAIYNTLSIYRALALSIYLTLFARTFNSILFWVYFPLSLSLAAFSGRKRDFISYFLSLKRS